MGIDTEEDAEFSVLDALIVIAENIRLLILGPVLVGLLAWGVPYALPQRFTSEAVMALPTSSTALNSPQVIAMVLSPWVLDPVIKSFRLFDNLPIELARTRFTDQIRVSVGKDTLLRLEVTAKTAVTAQAIANAIVDSWLKSTLPGELDRQDLEKRLAYAKFALEAVNRLLDRLTSEEPANLKEPLQRGERGSSIVSVGELQSRYFGEVQSISRALLGLSRDVIRQPPTLPTEPASPKKGLIAIVAALVSGVVLLLWAFARRAWSTAAQDPRSAEKLAKLRAAIGFQSRHATVQD